MDRVGRCEELARLIKLRSSLWLIKLARGSGTRDRFAGASALKETIHELHRTGGHQVRNGEPGEISSFAKAAHRISILQPL